jgi:GNAT superfamily N-acetyltransferase
VIGLQEAFEVFARSFAFVRSQVYPSEFVKLGSVFAVRDPLPRKHAPRGTQFFSVDKPAELVIATIKSHARGSYSLWDAVSEEKALGPAKMSYKRAGFRALRTERIMAARIEGREVQPYECPCKVKRVSTLLEIERIKSVSGSRPLRPEHLESDDSPIRCYYASNFDGPIGWATSVRTGVNAYVSGMYVRENFRRQGIGRAILDYLMRDDGRLGVEWSVLVANNMGAKLYPHLGYETLGFMQGFTPVRGGLVA